MIPQEVTKRKRRLELLSSAQVSVSVAVDVMKDARAKATEAHKSPAKRRTVLDQDHRYGYGRASPQLSTPKIIKSRQNKTPPRNFLLLFFAVAVIALSKSSDIIITTTEAFVFVIPSASQSQFQRRNHHQKISIYSPSSTTTFSLQMTSSSSPPSISSDLQSLTVKELKELVKTAPDPPERGTLSKLKKKQDLIEYLEDKIPVTQNDNNKDGNGISNLTVEQKTNGATVAKKSGPQKMPSMNHNKNDKDDHTTTHASSDQKNTSSTTIKQPPQQKIKKQPPLSQKDRIFQKVYHRYPPLKEQHQMAEQKLNEQKMDSNGQEEEEEEEYPKDVRQMYHPIFQSTHNVTSCDMDIVFVGTASCTPGVTRGVSCTALRLNWKRRASFQDPNKAPLDPNNNNRDSGFQGGTWLFDVGECTQLQVQKTASVKPSKITKIFVTHAHGDHSFGLPGLLCLMGQDRDRANNGDPIEIYGPEGLRKWLRVAIRYSVSRIVPPYRVHEIKDVPMAPEWQFNSRSGRYFYKGLHDNNKRTKRWGMQGLPGEDPNNWISQAERIPLEPNFQYGEIPGGRDIYPIYDHPLSNDGAPVWEVEDEEDVKVYAAPMSHGIPCLGYVVEEASRPGRLRNELVEPLVRRNVQALKESGFKVPMKAMAVIKNLPIGSAFTFPDGTVITQEEAVEPPRRGRKVVICGDTANCRALEVLAKDADVLVHECTNAYLPGLDKQTNLRVVTKDAVIHGHSTPEIAGHFARKTNAKRLLLNHFSARYKGDPSVDSLSIMTRIEEQAISASGLNDTTVAAAWDLMVLPIPSD